MGARTLVAVERPNGRYDCYHSQWGGEHVDRLVALIRAGEAQSDLVDPTPLRTSVTAAGVLDSLDPREYEAFVVDDGRLTAYLVCRLDLEVGRETEPAGALVPWRDEASAAEIRRFLRTTKDVLGDAVEAGLLSAPAARRYLAVRLARHPGTPADPTAILWLPVGGGPVR